MTFVYVLEVGEYDQAVTIGVFSTLGLAQTAADQAKEDAWGRTGEWKHVVMPGLSEEWWIDGDAHVTRYRLDEAT